MARPRGNPAWQKGKSGNPSGRPKDTLGVFLREKKNLPQEIYEAVYPLLKSDDPTTRLRAAEFLRDTRDGRPYTTFTNEVEDGPVVFEIVSYARKNAA